MVRLNWFIYSFQTSDLFLQLFYLLLLLVNGLFILFGSSDHLLLFPFHFFQVFLCLSQLWLQLTILWLQSPYLCFLDLQITLTFFIQKPMVSMILWYLHILAMQIGNFLLKLPDLLYFKLQSFIMLYLNRQQLLLQKSILINRSIKSYFLLFKDITTELNLLLIFVYYQCLVIYLFL